jgi:hypothetical protein
MVVYIFPDINDNEETDHGVSAAACRIINNSKQKKQ